MSARSLSRAECRSLLGSKRIGRVVFTDRALPSALPVNYLLIDDHIVFRTDPAGLLARVLDGDGGAVLGFEVDEVDESLEAGWSVLVVGLATRVPDQESRWLDKASLRSWGADHASLFARIPFDRVTGRVVGQSSTGVPEDIAGPVATTGPVT